MREPSRTPVLVGFMLAGLIAFFAGLALGESEETWTQTLEGEVLEAESDADGNVLRVSIDDIEWGPVLVADDAKGKELSHYVGEDVVATGQMQDVAGEEGRFDYVIVVERFSPLREEEEFDDPETEPEEPGDLTDEGETP